MWELTNIERRPAELDFSSSGGRIREVGQLFAGPTQIANAVEFTGWQDEHTQLVVCEHCGTVHCASGGWVSILDGGNVVVLGPDSRLFQAERLDRLEYEPPWYVKERGWPYMSLTTFAALRKIVPQLGPPDRLRPLRQREVAAMVRWEAPAKVLGKPFKAMDLSRDKLLACTTGEIAVESDRLSRVVSSWLSSDLAVRLEPCRPDDVPMEFFLDVAGITAWRPAVVRDGIPVLCLEPGLVAVASAR